LHEVFDIGVLIGTYGVA